MSGLVGSIPVRQCRSNANSEKNSRWFESRNCSSREIMHDKSSRTCRDALDAFCVTRCGKLRAVEFLVSTLFRRFLYHFLEPSYARARGWKLRRKIVIRADDYYRSALLRARREEGQCWELALSRGPQGAKMMFAPIRELRAISRGRVTASLLGTSARVRFIFAILHFNSPRSVRITIM